MTGILFVTRNFPPLVGGMERLALEAVRALQAEWAVDLLGPKGCETWTEGLAWGIEYRSAGRFLVSSLWHGRRMARAGSPRLVMGGSGLAAPAVLAAARPQGAGTACLVHGLDLVVDHIVYRRLCLPALRTLDLVIANSRNTARLAEQAGVAPERIQVLHPGVQLDHHKTPAELFLSAFPAARERPLLLSVGRLLPRKGVVDFVAEVLPQVVAQHPEVLLVIAGDAARDSLTRSGNESRRLGQCISRQGLQHNVLLTGRLDDELRDSLYSAGRLLVFPVKDLPGDVEGFGMVALEAAAHGVPTVAFQAGGVADAVADGISGTLVSAGGYRHMAAVIHGYLSGRSGAVDDGSCRAFAQPFAWPRYADQLRDLVRPHMTVRPE